MNIYKESHPQPVSTEQYSMLLLQTGKTTNVYSQLLTARCISTGCQMNYG